MKDDRLYIRHVLDCVRRIDLYCQNGEDAFRDSELIQDSVLRNLQILAESTQRISEYANTRRPFILKLTGGLFRDSGTSSSMDYLGVNLERIWQIVSAHLPVLGSQMEIMRDEANPRG